MELPEHTCISCAYLYKSGTDIISTTHREWALDNSKWNSGGIDYQQLICHMGEQNYSDFNKRNKVIDIRNEVIKSNKCKYWKRFIGISPIATEQRGLSKWTRLTFWVVVATLIVAVVSLIYTLATCDSQPPINNTIHYSPTTSA